MIQASRIPIWVAGAASGLAAGAFVLALSLAWNNRALREHLADAKDQLGDAAKQVADLRTQQAATAAELEAQHRQLAALQADLDAWRQNAANEAAPPDTPRLVRARVFAGGQYLGLGWVQSTPAGADANAGMSGLATVVADHPATSPPGASWGYQPPQTATAVSFSQAYQYQPYLYTTGWVDGYWPTNREPHQPFAPAASPRPGADPQPPTAAPTSPAAVTASGASGSRQRILATRMTLPARLPYANSGIGASGQRIAPAPLPRPNSRVPAPAQTPFRPVNPAGSRITPAPVPNANAGLRWQR